MFSQRANYLIASSLHFRIVQNAARKAAPLLATLLVAITLNTGLSIPASAAPDDISVDSEYGNLKEVVVGVPYFIYPDRVPKWGKELMKILPKDEVAKAIARAGRDSKQIGKYDAMEKENKELIAILEKAGVKVWRPEVLTRGRVAENLGKDYVHYSGLSQQYTRDPFIVIGNNVIENAMGSLYRRCDIFGLQRVFMDRVMGSNARWVSMPIPDYSTMIANGNFDKTGFPVLEGGDVIVLGKKIFVGISQNRTTGSSDLGYQWLKSYLEPQGYDVERVRLADDILHLDVALSIPRPGLMIVCQEVMLDGVPSYFNGWKRIEVSRDETRYLAANGLPIDKDHYIMGYNSRYDNKRIKDALEAYGITVYPIFFGNHTEDGGSIRCSTNPLIRKESDVSSPSK